MTNEKLIQTAKEATRNDTVLQRGIVDLLCQALEASDAQVKQLAAERDAVAAEMLIVKTDYATIPEVKRIGWPHTPNVDAAIASLRAEGVNFAASRLAAAYNHGFIDKPLAEVGDVVRMILTAKEDLANNPAADGLSGQYAEISLAEWVAQLCPHSVSSPAPIDRAAANPGRMNNAS